jgi:hypothetical protein
MKILFRINKFSISYTLGREVMILNKYTPGHSVYHNLEFDFHRYNNVIRGFLALLYN